MPHPSTSPSSSGPASLDAFSPALTSERAVVTTLAGSGEAGFLDAAADTARFHGPDGIAVDAHGNIYVTDVFNHCVRRIAPDGTTSTLTPGIRFKSPDGIAVDAVGNVYVTDGHMCLWKLTPAGDASVLKDAAGEPVASYFAESLALDVAGNLYGADTALGCIYRITPEGAVSVLKDAAGHDVRFDYPAGLAVDAEGTLYVAEQLRNRIRKLTASGELSALRHADGSEIRLDCPAGLALDSEGNLCVAEVGRHRVLRITPAGVVTRLAGGPSAGFQDGLVAEASFDTPIGVAAGPDGAIYVADSHNHRIRRIR